MGKVIGGVSWGSGDVANGQPLHARGGFLPMARLPLPSMPPPPGGSPCPRPVRSAKLTASQPQAAPAQPSPCQPMANRAGVSWGRWWGQGMPARRARGCFPRDDGMVMKGGSPGVNGFDDADTPSRPSPSGASEIGRGLRCLAGEGRAHDRVYGCEPLALIARGLPSLISS